MSKKPLNIMFGDFTYYNRHTLYSRYTPAIGILHNLVIRYVSILSRKILEKQKKINLMRAFSDRHLI